MGDGLLRLSLQVLLTLLYAREADATPNPLQFFARRAAGGAIEVATSLGGALLLREHVLDARYIPSESMLPTFEVGDLLLLDKLSHRLRTPSRGDVVCFKPPPALVRIVPALANGNMCCIKRIVAVAGDQVSVQRGRLVVNGVEQAETYLMEAKMKYRMARIRVPPGHYFVLGDNRDHSVDSHCWGCLSHNLLLGVPLCTYWPPRRMRFRGAYRDAAVSTA